LPAHVKRRPSRSCGDQSDDIAASYMSRKEHCEV
jgi:hypothetical protein